MTDKQRLTAAALLQTEVHQAPVSHPRLNRSKKGEERFLCNTLSTARIASGGVQRLTSAAASEKPHVPSSMADILYALFTLFILTRLISPRQIYNSLYLLPKNKKNLRVDITFHAALPPASLLFFFFFVFLLEFLICKRGEQAHLFAAGGAQEGGHAMLR